MERGAETHRGPAALCCAGRRMAGSGVREGPVGSGAAGLSLAPRQGTCAFTEDQVRVINTPVCVRGAGLIVT